MTKSDLRKIYLAKQKSLSRGERERRSARVAELLFENFDFAAFDFVNCFVTLEKNGEIDTFNVFQRLRREFPNVVTTAPRVDFAMNALENVAVSPDSQFVENKWRILEPAGNELIDAVKLDAVLVPLIAFDEFGFRVGYGKGFYDKFLIECRADCLKTGLSLFPPVEKIADAESFDVPLDFCVTPNAVWRF